MATPKKTDMSYTSSEIVSIIVGVGNKTEKHNIHRQLLEDKCPFLVPLTIDDDTAQPRPNSKTIHLPEVDNDAFAVVRQWLYAPPESTTPVTYTTFALLISSYLLAHSLQLDSLKNDLVDATRRHHASQSTTKIPLRVLISFATTLPPSSPPAENQNPLLHFFITQLTYRIATRGYERYSRSPTWKSLLQTSPDVVMWHLDALHHLMPRCMRHGEDESSFEVQSRKSGPETPATWKGCWFHLHQRGMGQSYKTVEIVD